MTPRAETRRARRSEALPVDSVRAMPSPVPIVVAEPECGGRAQQCCGSGGAVKVITKFQLRISLRLAGRPSERPLMALRSPALPARRVRSTCASSGVFEPSQPRM